jgi:Mn2+/Fe2+ NRAMP family transporter
MGKRLSSILFWSIISAAFIGPGTVTTAARAGASFQYSLIWALLFGVIACLVLQEAAARLTLGSGLKLGEAISSHFQDSPRVMWVRYAVVGAIVFGCAAYQAGNLMGAASGLEVVSGFAARWGILSVAIPAILVLWFGRLKFIQQLMTVLVAFMGLMFLFLAFQFPIVPSAFFKGAFIPSLPGGSEALALGLIGTTIVPYNLFLASGISSRQNLTEMRFGLSVSILFGGLISLAILLVGSALQGDFSFTNLALLMDEKLNGYGSILLGFGLFCAGFSSGITAPYAAAITWQSMRPGSSSIPDKGFKAIWIGVMLVGLLFGLSGLQPIAIILSAQAINGFLLPVSAIFLLRVVRDEGLLSGKYLNTRVQTVLMGLVVWIAIVLGLHNLGFVLEQLIIGFSAQGLYYVSTLVLFGALLLRVSLLKKTTLTR